MNATQSTDSTLPETSAIPPHFRAKLAKYRVSDTRKSVWQLVNTLVPFLAVYVLALLSLQWSYWITLGLSVPAGLLLIRIFVIQHDCGHGSFFKSKKANDMVGFWLGIMVMTPYYTWRWSHAQHHAASGDLDRRGHGDIPTVTIKEYQAMTWWQKLGYRVYRNPIVTFIIVPIILFALIQRSAYDMPKENYKARESVYWTNWVLAIYIGIGCMIFGVWPFIGVHLPMMFVASSTGMYLFYVQHQYDDTYWRQNEEWSYADAAIHGSSYFDLPPVMRWFTANIGYHHIHHLDSRIPNYNLKQCYDENPEFQNAYKLTFFSSIKCIFVKLWDEDKKQMVGFDAARSQSA